MQLNVAPAASRYMLDLERENRTLWRTNQRLARDKLAVADSAAASALRPPATSDELPARVSSAVAARRDELAQRTGDGGAQRSFRTALTLVLLRDPRPPEAGSAEMSTVAVGSSRRDRRPRARRCWRACRPCSGSWSCSASGCGWRSGAPTARRSSTSPTRASTPTLARGELFARRDAGRSATRSSSGPCTRSPTRSSSRSPSSI